MRATRIALAAGLLWYATRDVNWSEVGDAVRRASWGWLLAAILLTLVDRLLMAWRWLALLRGVEANRPLATAALLRVFFVSTFVGTFLPGSIGGDAVRSVSAARHGVTMANAVASVAIDRLLGTLSVLVMAVLGLVLVGQLVDTRLLPLALVLAGAAGAATWTLLFAPGVYERLLRVTGVHRFATLDRLARKFLTAASQYGARRSLVAGVLSASCAVQVLRTLQTWCLGLGLGLTIGGEWYFAFVPVIVLIVLLPISIGGLGPANLAFVTLFGFAGVPDGTAFTLSVLFLALGVLGNIPGGILFSVGGGRQREG